MVNVILNEHAIEPGEPYFAVYVDRPNGVGQSIIADLKMDLTGPASPEVVAPCMLSGFELPALELLHKARERATERGVKKILLVDPLGLLPLARVNRYAER